MDRSPVGDRPDAVVVGAGPAGALAARQLARFGVAVVLVHRARRRQHLGESLGASAPRLLASYGLELPDSVWVPRPADHLVHWGGREDRIAAQPPGAPSAAEGQRLVWRDRLDAWALAEAERSGAVVIEGSARVEDREGGALTVVRPGADPREIRARVLVDASGRAGVLTRRRRRWPPFRTTALTAHYRAGPEPETLVASFPDGWVWSAPLPDGRRDVTVLLDREDATGEPDRRHREAVEAVGFDGSFVVGAPPPVRAADATPYALDSAAVMPTRGGWWFAVGDAASALDPLTGLGTMKAMESGLTAAVVVRTVLAQPTACDFALRFHADKERGLAKETGERVAAFHAEEHRYAARPFWRRRSRRAPARAPFPARLVPAPGAEIEVRGVLRGDWVVEEETLVLPGRPRPAYEFGGVPLAELFRAVRAGALPDRFPVRPVRAALEWLWREGFVEAAPK